MCISGVGNKVVLYVQEVLLTFTLQHTTNMDKTSLTYGMKIVKCWNLYLWYSRRTISFGLASSSLSHEGLAASVPLFPPKLTFTSSRVMFILASPFPWSQRRIQGAADLVHTPRNWKKEGERRRGEGGIFFSSPYKKTGYAHIPPNLISEYAPAWSMSSFHLLHLATICIHQWKSVWSSSMTSLSSASASSLGHSCGQL